MDRSKVNQPSLAVATDNLTAPTANNSQTTKKAVEIELLPIVYEVIRW